MILRFLCLILNNSIEQPAWPESGAETQIPRMHARKLEAVLRRSVQANAVNFFKTAVSLNLTPDYVLDSEKPFSTGRYDCRIFRGCIFSVLGKRKYQSGDEPEVIGLLRSRALGNKVKTVKNPGAAIYLINYIPWH